MSGGVKRARGRTWTLEALDRDQVYELRFDSETHRWECLGQDGAPVVSRSGSERTRPASSTAESMEARPASGARPRPLALVRFIDPAASTEPRHRG